MESGERKIPILEKITDYLIRTLTVVIHLKVRRLKR